MSVVRPPPAIQDSVVHLLHVVCMGLSGAVLAACAHAREEMHTSTVTAEPAPSSIDREVIAVDESPPPEVRPPARPRLSQTITLGQGSEQPYMPSAPPSQTQQAPSQSVVVNNNVVVQGAPGYYGYGGHYGRGGHGRATTFYGNDGRTVGHHGTPQWGSTGWEGARRTAAPGQTPGIGGNWAPPPSYGPAQMK